MSVFRIQFFTGLYRIPKILLKFRITGIPVASQHSINGHKLDSVVLVVWTFGTAFLDKVVSEDVT